jgi:hypothetical protein
LNTGNNDVVAALVQQLLAQNGANDTANKSLN